ncbi:MAG TPA: hypothetical protein VFF63_08640 [Candidatus Babeliales bacterium]|nr:hypothetical protein [Candidatus Babeliales bacterium]
MRFSLLGASSVIAIAVALAACSSNGSQTIPGGPQAVAPMGHQSGFHLEVVGLEPAAASCGSGYAACYDITPGKTYKDEWCIVPESKEGDGCHSSDLSPGTWTWKLGKVEKAKKSKKVAIKVSIKPNPGNPTYNYVLASKKVKSTKGKVGYEFSIEACNSTSYCATGEIGIIVK